jgi:hypothetical protein
VSNRDLVRNFTYYIVLSEHNCNAVYYMDSISGVNNKQVIVLDNYITFPCLRVCMTDGLMMACKSQHLFKGYARLLKFMFLQMNINGNKM